MATILADRSSVVLALLGAVMLLSCGGDTTSPEPDPDPDPPSVASVAVTPGTLDLVPAQTGQLTATPRDASGAALTGRSVTWASEDDGVAMVNGSGLVTGVAPGVATITATSEGRSGTVEIEVADGGFVGAAGGTVAGGGGDVSLLVPAGALSTGTALTIAPVTPAAAPGLVEGTGWELGPAGTDFAEPVTVTLAYDPAAVPAGIDAERLAVHRWSGSTWEPLSGGGVDTEAEVVSGLTDGFSVFAVLGLPSNPVPTVTSIAPDEAAAGDDAFTLTVSGEGFVEGAIVLWNGDPRTTTFVSATELTAEIPAEDIAAPATVEVAVFNPEPDGGTSEPLPFMVASVATLVVNATDDLDDGACDATHCSLREALVAANANADHDVVHFAIPGNGPHTIQPTTALPEITARLTLDAATQAGADCSEWPPRLMIELNGDAMVFTEPGLQVEADDTWIRGLVINGIDGEAILIRADRVSIQCSFVGTDPSGTVGVGNGREGILLEDAVDVRIGGATPGMGNLISANAAGGILIEGTSARATIQGNYIGPDVTGTVALSADTPLGDGERGIHDEGALGGHQIGGTDHTEGVCDRACNLVSGNDSEGILVDDDGGAPTVIEGNFVGTDISGTVALPNDHVGIEIEGADGRIGGLEPGAGNLVSGNRGDGIEIDGPGMQVLGNRVGTDAAGVGALANSLDNPLSPASGIAVADDGARVEGNLVAYNEGAGIRIFGRSGGQYHSNAFLGNSIVGNGGLGIDLGSDGVDDNDVGDADEGPNFGQNYPAIEVARATSSTILGGLESRPSTTYRIEVFANETCDASGFGEGEEFVGAFEVTTDAGGFVGFEQVLDGEFEVGSFITATATDPDGNTSEFSACVPATEGD